MTCKNNDTITFEVFELSGDGKKRDIPTGKTFSVGRQESFDLCRKLGLYNYNNDRVSENGIVLAFFEKVYGFTIGLSGHGGRWDNENTFTVYWRTDVWCLKRVV